MGDVVNLNKFRKQKKRKEDEKQADENRVRFGRTKSEKKKDNFDLQKSREHVDQSKLDTPDTPSDND